MPPTADRLRRLQSLSGVLPLVLFVIFHVWEIGAALDGREAFASRLQGIGMASRLIVQTVVVVIPLVVHVGLGLWRARTERGAAGYGTIGNRSLQRVTGLVVLVFIGVHLSHTWLRVFGGHDASGLYELLRLELSTTPFLAIYVVGLAALSLHLGQGMIQFGHTWGLVRTPRGGRIYTLVAVVLAVFVFASFVNSLSHFATGRALVGAGGAVDEQPEPHSRNSQAANPRTGGSNEAAGHSARGELRAP